MRIGKELWLWLVLLFAAMSAEPSEVDRVRVVADAIRLRDAGYLEEAIISLERAREQWPSDSVIASSLQRMIGLRDPGRHMSASGAEASGTTRGTGDGRNPDREPTVSGPAPERGRAGRLGPLSVEDDPRLRKARAQLLAGEYAEAGRTLGEAEALSPDDPAVRLLQIQLGELMQEGVRLNRQRTRADMIHEVDVSWQRPMVFRPADETDGAIGDSNPLLDKLRRIRIPRVTFSSVELTSVIETLSELSVEHDTLSEEKSRGVNIVPLFGASPRENPKVSISLRNMSLEKILQFVTQQVNYQYDIVEDAVVVQPADGPEGAANVLTEFFPLSRATVIRITGAKSGHDPSGSDPLSPFESGSPEHGSAGGLSAEEASLRGFFQRAGVDFQNVRGASLAFDGTQLIVTQTSRNLERMRSILRRYDKTRQVEIEAKFLEVQQEDLDELGMQWRWQGDGKVRFDAEGNPLMTPTGAFEKSYRTGISTQEGNRNLSQAFGMDPSRKTVSITSPGSKIDLPIMPPMIPKTLNLAQDVAGGVLNSVGIIGDTELNVILRALSRKDGSDLLSAPRLTVLSGKTASITVAQELIYPQSYGDMRAEVSRATAQSDSGDRGGAVAITAGTPRDFTKRNVGVEMQVTPTVEDDDNISLLLEPKVTEFEGFVEYGGPSVAMSGDLTATVPSGFYQPIFSTRSVRTEVTIYDGATVVIGGLTREETKAFSDKVPLFGDIPLLGRLFRSQGETTRKRNLIIFVTANLVGAGGSPVKQSYPELEASSLYQNPVLLTPGGTVQRKNRGGRVE